MKDFKPQKVKVKNGSWTVFLGLCKGCGLCLVTCSQKSLSFSKKEGFYSSPVPQVDPATCLLCGLCENVCPDCAIKVTEK